MTTVGSVQAVKPNRSQTAVFVALVALFVLLPLFARVLPRPWTWVAVGAVVVALLAVIGWTIANRPDGILIDASGMSLARFQLVLWTVVFFSAWPAAVFINLAVGAANPLEIKVPEELWVLLGISTTSLVGSPVLQSDRRAKNALRTKTAMAASWADLFLGEEQTNQSTVDVANVQMFFFTVVIVFAYSITLLKLFTDTVGVITDLPTVDQSVVALLGISHAGFLANKPIPK